MNNRNLQYIKVYESHTQLTERLDRMQKAYNDLSVRWDTLKCVLKRSGRFSALTISQYCLHQTSGCRLRPIISTLDYGSV